MKHRFLLSLLAVSMLAGAGCASSKPEKTATTTERSNDAATGHKAPYATALTGTIDGIELDLSLTRAFDIVRGSFTYYEAGKPASGLILGSATGSDDTLLLGMYTGRWDDFASGTGTWQGDKLALELDLGGQIRHVTLAPVKRDGSATFDVVTATKNDPRDNQTDRCTFDFVYPVLTGGSAHLDEANAQIRTDFGLEPTSTPRLLAEDFVSRCAEDIRGLESDTTTADYAKDLSYDSQTYFSVERNRDGVVSFLIDSYDYEGGAHGMPGIYGVNVDLATGKEIRLGDIVKRDDLKPLLQMVESKVLERDSDALFDEPLAKFKEFVKDKKPATESDLVEFAGLDNFYLTETSIVFYWNVYEISPYAAGQLVVEIPYTDIKDMLRSDAPGSSLK